MNLKTVFICVAGNQRWGKGLSLAEALKIANVKFNDVKVDYRVVCCQWKEEMPDEKLDYSKCFWYVTDWGQVCFCSNLNDEDLALIKEFFIGYSYLPNSRYEKKPKKLEAV